MLRATLRSRFPLWTARGDNARSEFRAALHHQSEILAAIGGPPWWRLLRSNLQFGGAQEHDRAFRCAGHRGPSNGAVVGDPMRCRPPPTTVFGIASPRRPHVGSSGQLDRVKIHYSPQDQTGSPCQNFSFGPDRLVPMKVSAHDLNWHGLGMSRVPDQQVGDPEKCRGTCCAFLLVMDKGSRNDFRVLPTLPSRPAPLSNGPRRLRPSAVCGTVINAKRK